VKKKLGNRKRKYRKQEMKVQETGKDCPEILKQSTRSRKMKGAYRKAGKRKLWKQQKTNAYNNS